MSDSRSCTVAALIPARMASTRLPGKPLADIGGRPMIQHVWERAMRSPLVNAAAIVTPDEEIMEAAAGFGAMAIRTSSDHRSGTDRLAEAAKLWALKGDDIVVNVQGDEPFVDPEAISAAISPLLDNPALQMSSLMCPCTDEDMDNPDCVKVVCDRRGNALYFSRAHIPHPRAKRHMWRHIGLYAYRVDMLAWFAAQPATPLEICESLEQLRVLENGREIRMVAVAETSIGVDNPDDLERARRASGAMP